MAYRIVISIFLLLALFSCKHNTRQVYPAFYYWKTNFNIGEKEMSLLQETGSVYLYVRFFDIDLDPVTRQPVPVGILKADKNNIKSQKFIPVVYLTQRCLLELIPEAIPGLAIRTAKLLEDISIRYKINPHEIQLDCDWTNSTRNLYFAFLKELRRQEFLAGKELSCTIRMHQVKYVSRSGVPPVDRGMLMCYNMGNMKKYGWHNSILEIKEAQNYMNNIQQYPLKLDIALPVFHWAVLFDRRQFKGIVYNILQEDFKPGQLVQVKNDLFRFAKDVNNKGYFFRKGEEIRFERPSPNDLDNIACFVGDHINSNVFRVAFFHLDSTSVDGFSSADINSILDEF